MKLARFCIFLAISCFNIDAAFGRNYRPPPPAFITAEEFEVARELERSQVLDYSNLYNNSKQQEDDTVESDGFGTRNFVRNNKWPNGRIPYTVNANFDNNARTELAKALDDFHLKTCLQFVPKGASDAAYVELLRDDSVSCGLATVCRNGGKQYAWFNPGCLDARTMIHELGHTICMSHEQVRPDRDNYVRFDGAPGCVADQIGDLSFWTNPSYYDYFSVMQYDGGMPTNCIQPKMTLPDLWIGNPGRLSVLDAEKINERYECPGCRSYRWKPFDQITGADYLEPSGYEANGNPLYICRFYVNNGEIVVGKASVTLKACWVPFGGAEVGSGGSQKFEVLTNPKRVSFRWVPMSKGGNLPNGIIAGGRKTMKPVYGLLPETYYIARCAYQGQVVPGALHGNSKSMFMPFGGRENECTNFEVLTCN